MFVAGLFDNTFLGRIFYKYLSNKDYFLVKGVF